jgi:hypothetical protein
MSEITVDSATETLLKQAGEPVGLRSESGQFLGRFIPLNIEPRIDPEEIRRRFETGGGRPLADILAALETRG